VECTDLKGDAGEEKLEDSKNRDDSAVNHIVGFDFVGNFEVGGW
jgi:hypothetical protein